MESCKEGYIMRKSYTRKNGRKVKSTCVKHSKQNCPPGKTLRKGYNRKLANSVVKQGFIRGRSRVFPKTKKVHVKSYCTGPKSKIGPLKKGELSKYGYSYKLSEQERRSALMRASREFNFTSMYKKLDAVAKLSKTVNPKAAAVFSADRNWIHSKTNLR